MLTKRIIACLDVRDGRVVKGVQFVDIIDAGDPAELASPPRRRRRRRDCAPRHHRHARRPRHAARHRKAHRRTTLRSFTVGGGIRSAEDAAAVFDAGADKVSINSSAIAAARAHRRDRLQLWRTGCHRGHRRSPRQGFLSIPSAMPRSMSPEAARPQAARSSSGLARPSSAAPAKSCLPAWSTDGMRSGFDCELTARLRGRADPRHRQWWSRQRSTLRRSLRPRQGRCRTGREHLPFWCDGFTRAQGRTAARRRSGPSALLA